MPAIARFFADKTRAELEEQGQQYGVPVAGVLTLAEALTTEQIRARGFLREAELAPGVTGPVPAGTVEIDGARAWSDEGPAAAGQRVTHAPVLAAREHRASRETGRSRAGTIGLFNIAFQPLPDASSSTLGALLSLPSETMMAADALDQRGMP